eukprot:3167298-Lingulodinium_polyedra.AAC.1
MVLRPAVQAAAKGGFRPSIVAKESLADVRGVLLETAAQRPEEHDAVSEAHRAACRARLRRVARSAGFPTLARPSPRAHAHGQIAGIWI